MSARTRGRRSFRQIVNCELELRPLMNVFIVLIPMLLMSAVFVEIRVIEMDAPAPGLGAQAAHAERLDLAVRIEGASYVVEGAGLAPVSIPRPPAGAADARPGPAAAAELARTLAAVAAAHPQEKQVRIVASATTRYQEIVAVMDVARTAGLPQVALEGARDGGI